MLYLKVSRRCNYSRCHTLKLTVKVTRGRTEHQQLFALTAPDEVIKNVLKYSHITHYKSEAVVFRQGEEGTWYDTCTPLNHFHSCITSLSLLSFSSFYVIVRGSASILVANLKLQDSGTCDSEGAISDRIETTDANNANLRDGLGNEVALLGPGKVFGDVAMTQGSAGLRYASAVTNSASDLLVVDRTLYHRSLERVQKAEAKEKTKFVDSVSILTKWSQQNRSHLISTLQHGRHSDIIFKQGAPASHVYFIRCGLVKLVVSHTSEGETRGSAVRRRYGYQEGGKREKLSANKVQEICIVGCRDIVGDVEAVYDLSCYTCTAKCLTRVDVYSLDKATFRHLFKQKNCETFQTLNMLVSYKLLSRSHNLERFASFNPLLKRAKRTVELAEQKQLRKQLEKRKRTNLSDAVKKRIGGGRTPAATGVEMKSNSSHPRPERNDTETFLTNVIQSETDDMKDVAEAVADSQPTTSGSTHLTIASTSATSTNERIPLPILLTEPAGGRWTSCFKAAVDMSNALRNTSREDTMKRLFSRLDQVKQAEVERKVHTGTRCRSLLKNPSPATNKSRSVGHDTKPVLVSKRKLDETKFICGARVTPVRGYVQERTRQGAAIIRTRL